MSINWQNLVVDMPAYTRIASRPFEGPKVARRQLLPDPQLDRSFEERPGQLADLGILTLLDGPGFPTTSRALPASRESGLPAATRLLADDLPPGRLGDGHLAGQHAQHDPDLALSRNERALPRSNSPFRTDPTSPARMPYARHR